MIRNFENIGRGILVIAALTLAAGLTSPPARGSDLSKFLRELFSDMSGREPTGSELNYHAGLNRDGGSLENTIVLFGSDEIYATQGHRDPNLYVQRMYETFLGREPRPDEQAFWANQIMQPGVRRVDMVRAFCRSNHVTQLPSFLPTPPAYYPPAGNEQIALQLVDRANLLLNFIKAEMGNTYFGRGVFEQGAKFLSVAKQYRNVVRSPNSTAQQIDVSLSNLDRSLQDLERRFYRVPGSSSQSRQMLQQVSQLVAAAHYSSGGITRPPGVSRPPLFPPPSNPGISQRAVREVNRLSDESRRLAYGLLSYQHEGPFYAHLSRDVQDLSTRIESLNLMVRQGQSSASIQRSMRGIVDASRYISRDMNQADSNVRRAWWNFQSQLQSTAGALGVNSDFNIQASQPVVIDRPAWGGFPFQPSPARPPAHQEECVVLADQLLGKVDSYAQTLAPVASSNRNAASLLRDLQDFKRYVLAFRQAAAGGRYATSLSSSADRIMSQYQQLSRNVSRLVSQDSSLNSPLFYQIGELVQRIRVAAGGR